jgi:hypothetical protein
MPHYRATIRHGRPQRHHVVDIEAESLREATRLALDHFPAPAEEADAADLLEIRRMADPEARPYGPG